MKFLQFLLLKIKYQVFFLQKGVDYIHGQMESRSLESKVLTFFNGQIDILVCTSIIESGLDVSNANTIIINNAHRFGLSQLYQIRGRVGRSTRRASCLLLIPKKDLDRRSFKRLKTIERYRSLGYDISMKDLEIRGLVVFLVTSKVGTSALLGLSFIVNY